jgi:hypothetical protein
MSCFHVNHHGMTHTDNPALYQVKTALGYGDILRNYPTEPIQGLADTPPVFVTEKDKPVDGHFFKVPLLESADKFLGKVLSETVGLNLKALQALREADEKLANSPFFKKHFALREPPKPKVFFTVRKDIVEATVKASLEDQIRLRVTDEDIERGLKRTLYINEKKRELEQKQTNVFEKQKKAAFAKAIRAEAEVVGKASSKLV